MTNQIGRPTFNVRLYVDCYGTITIMVKKGETVTSAQVTIVASSSFLAMIVDRFVFTMRRSNLQLQSDGEDRLIRLIDFGNSSEKIFVYAQSIFSAEK